MIPIFYINLDTAPRRSAALADQLSAMGLVGTRISALTPLEIAPDLIARYCNGQLYHWVRPVELACSMSHLNAWRALIATGEPYGLVLEDDAILSRHLPHFLQQWETAVMRPDLARLETSLQELRIDPTPGRTIAGVGLHRPRALAGGSAAYLVSSACARNFLERAELYYRPIDNVLFDPAYPLWERPSLLQAVPGLAVQRDRLEGPLEIELSTIKPGLAALYAPTPRSPFRQAAFSVRQWFERHVIAGSAKGWLDLTGRRKRRMDFLP